MSIHVHAKKISFHFLFLFTILQIVSNSISHTYRSYITAMASLQLPLSLGDGKPISDKLPVPPVLNNGSLDAMEQKTNFSSPAASGPALVSAPAVRYEIVHIPRKKRQAAAPMNFMDLHTTHLPCDLDTSQKQEWLPNHCEYIFANRYVSEGFYRNYQLYRLEGFMFGMAYERLKRYETEQPTFDYRNVLS